MSLGIGLIGCGFISDIYLTNLPQFRNLRIAVCADQDTAAAERQGRRYGVTVQSVDNLLANPEVNIVLNLTNPGAHAAIALAALSANKHVYSEKPLATSVEDGALILAFARERNLRVGAAPDTVLGPGLQNARRLIDAGVIGRPISGVAAVMSQGMEHWHPNPGFYFQPGGGPVLDMGPYYITALVTLLGPVTAVTATGQIGRAERVVTAPNSPIRGQSIRVETFTTLQALLLFASGAQVTFLASWDTPKHGLPPLELHGTVCSLRVPDPNWFGGVVATSDGDEWLQYSTAGLRFGVPNDPPGQYRRANYRGLGLAEMARAILEGRPHRASGDLALHVLDVMLAIIEAAKGRKWIEIVNSCERPAAFDGDEAVLYV